MQPYFNQPQQTQQYPQPHPVYNQGYQQYPPQQPMYQGPVYQQQQPQ